MTFARPCSIRCTQVHIIHHSTIHYTAEVHANYLVEETLPQKLTLQPLLLNIYQLQLRLLPILKLHLLKSLLLLQDQLSLTSDQHTTNPTRLSLSGLSPSSQPSQDSCLLQLLSLSPSESREIARQLTNQNLTFSLRTKNSGTRREDQVVVSHLRM